MQGQQGEDRPVRGIFVHRGTGDCDIKGTVGAGHFLAFAVLVHEVDDGPVSGIEAELLLQRKAVKIELLGIRSFQKQLCFRISRLRSPICRGFRYRGILFSDQGLKFRRHGGSCLNLAINCEGQASVNRADPEPAVVLRLLGEHIRVLNNHLILLRFFLCCWERLRLRKNRHIFGNRNKRNAQLLISRGVLGDHEGLHNSALEAFRLGRVIIAARSQMVNAILSDRESLAVRIVYRYGRDRLITEKAQCKGLPAILRENAVREQIAQHQDAKQDCNNLSCFHLLSSPCMFK